MKRDGGNAENTTRRRNFCKSEEQRKKEIREWKKGREKRCTCARNAARII